MTTSPTLNLSFEQGSLYSVTIPGAVSPTAAARAQLRNQAGGTAYITLTTGGHGIVNDGAGNFVLTITPSQSLAISAIGGVWDIFQDPDGVADDASLRVAHGSWAMSPNITNTTPTPSPNPTPAPSVGDTITWNGSNWVPTALAVNRFPDVFDIRDYGALTSPGDIGPAVQAACTACKAYGGGVVYIPPRADARQWGWTTAVSVDALQSMSISVQGVPGQTAISLQVGQSVPLTFPSSNGICQVDGLTFTAQGTVGQTNCACVIDFQQSRIGILSRCQFFGVQCNGTGQGMVRIVADTTHVFDCLFAGCCYAGAAFAGGQLSITGNRDASVVESCRFTLVDGTFDGVTYNKTDFALNWYYLWYGSQGVDGVVTAYGEVVTRNCYFESEARASIGINPESGFISDHHRIQGCTFNIGAGGGSRPAILAGVDNGGTAPKQVIVEGCMFGNAASGVSAVVFRGGRLLMRGCRNINQGGHTYNVQFSGATTYVELDECDGLLFDTSLATPAHGITKVNGVVTTVFP